MQPKDVEKKRMLRERLAIKEIELNSALKMKVTEFSLSIAVQCTKRCIGMLKRPLFDLLTYQNQFVYIDTYPTSIVTLVKSLPFAFVDHHSSAFVPKLCVLLPQLPSHTLLLLPVALTRVPQWTWHTSCIYFHHHSHICWHITCHHWHQTYQFLPRYPLAFRRKQTMHWRTLRGSYPHWVCCTATYRRIIRVIYRLTKRWQCIMDQHDVIMPRVNWRLAEYSLQTCIQK